MPGAFIFCKSTYPYCCANNFYKFVLIILKKVKHAVS